MKVCCSKTRSKKEVVKITTGEKVSSILPLIITFIATQHWLHGLIFILLGGTANQLIAMSTDEMLPFQRGMIVITLVTILWSVYQLLKDGIKHKGMILMTSFSSLVGLTYVAVTLFKNGW